MYIYIYILCICSTQCLNWIKGEGGAEIWHVVFHKITENLFFTPYPCNKYPILQITIIYNNF